MEPLDPTRVRWIITTEHEHWTEATPSTAPAEAAMPSVFLRLDDPQQQIEGFGACFSELGWTSLQHLGDADRDAVLRELFAPGVGANLTLCRTPIGANDIARGWYSYDETPNDLALEHFSIDNDLDAIVPFIRSAQSLQPDLSLWASPWSPPTWMKANGHYAGARPHPAFGSLDNGLREDQVGVEGTDMIRLDDDILRAYAAYFGRFIDSYAELGIPVRMVMPQNEFNSAQTFPSCTWTPEGLARFIRHLAPEMQRRGVDLFLGTLERPDDGLVERVLADSVARRAIAGVGAQWAGKEAVPFVHHAHPELRVYQTEQECGDGSNSWRLARHAWTLMRHFLGHGASAYMYWNISLELGGTTSWGWAQNSLFTVNADTGEYVANHDLSILKHVSHFVRPGARVIPTLSSAGYDNQLAFRNPDGEIVVVMQNDMAEPMPVTVLMEERLLAATLPADSLSTFAIV